MKISFTNEQLEQIEEVLHTELQKARADYRKADWVKDIDRIRVRLSFAREMERSARLNIGERSNLERVIREAIEEEVHLATDAQMYHDLYDILDRVVGASA